MGARIRSVRQTQMNMWRFGGSTSTYAGLENCTGVGGGGGGGGGGATRVIWRIGGGGGAGKDTTMTGGDTCIAGR